jgi:hypothetical protein
MLCSRQWLVCTFSLTCEEFKRLSRNQLILEDTEKGGSRRTGVLGRLLAIFLGSAELNAKILILKHITSHRLSAKYLSVNA